MTQLRFKIKKGDTVEVITGNQKGVRGVIQKVDLEKGRVFVAGVRMVVRHMRPSSKNPEGKIEKHHSIDISNVSLVDPSTDLSGRVGYKIDSSGKKTRFFKQSGTLLETSIIKKEKK
jgi:large subunit ribosomal protein L24